MNGKNRMKKIIGSGVFVLCMAFAIIFTVIRTDASSTAGGIQYALREVGVEKVPTMAGYLFAGWYQTESEDTAIRTPQEGEKYYAKFVPENVLGIQAQVSSTLLADDNASNAAVRFVTTVDSLSYQKIGFLVKKGTGAEKEANVTNKVYKSIYYVNDASGAVDGAGTPMEIKPTEFDDASRYFKTYTIGKIPASAYNTDITVTPYWITLDGTKVVGTKSIKTVNLGRSWVYVAAEANVDGLELGTYNNPYTDFADGLDKIQLENKGRVIAKGNSPIPVSSEFAWNKHTVKVDNVEKACTITITGENSSAGFDFSAFSPLYINDNVVFDNMTLKFANANVYANGNELVVNESVTSNNASTTIFGGGYKATLTSGTNIEIHAGNYKEIWGGNKDGGSITGDIYVTVTNANLFNAEKSDVGRIFGGGNGNSTVNGDIYVTVGQGFNKDYNQPINDYNKVLGANHYRRSAVYGAGAGKEVVNGNTYVTIEDNAKVDYVYGGVASSATGTVKGTCHVTLNGGTVFSIYGGSAGDDAIDDATMYKNHDTSVVIERGEVWQIMGGNGSGMKGNAYVEISGGKIHRRIYGGCYSDTTCVDGRTTVVINKSDSLVFDTSLAEKLNVGSSNTGNVNEIKTIVFNDVYSANKLNSSKDYNYLVTKQGNGSVAVDKTILQLTPISNDVVGSITSGDTASYFRGISKYILAGATENGKKEVSVDFSPNGTLDLTSCEALNEGIYYSKLEDAVATAKEISILDKETCTVTLLKDATIEESLVAAKEISLLDKACTVTLLKDATIEESIVVDKSAKFVLQSDGEKKITFASTEDSLIQVKDTAQLTLDSVTLYGGNIGLEGLSGKINTNNVMINNATYGVVVRSTGNVNLDNVTIGTTGAHAIQSAGKLNITTKNTENAEAKNGVTINSAGSYGINIIGGTVVANAVTIQESTSHALYVTETDDVNFAGLTVNKAGGNAVYVKEAGTKASISDFAIGATTSAAVRLFDGVDLSLTDGTIKTTSYGIYMDGAAVAQATNVKITRIASNANTLIVVKGTSRLTMSNNSNGESRVDGNKSTGYTGRGVEVQGTFVLNGGNIINHQISADTDGAVITANKSDGAAVYVVAGGTFTMNGGAVKDNQAKNAGAAVAINGTGANFTLKDGTISGNKGAYGAVMARNGAFNMNGGTIIQNTSTTSGGGVTVSSGIFEMSAGTISNNTATKEGGGVYINNAGTIRLLENSTGKITDNTAGIGGGGVSAENANATIQIAGGEISSNTATYGGGIMIRSCKAFTISGGKINGNTAKGSGGNGGGIYLKPGYGFTMDGTNGIITGNMAGNLGGGVYAEGNSTITLKAGEISSNTQKYGTDNIANDIRGNSNKGEVKLYTGFIIDANKIVSIPKTDATE